MSLTDASMRNPYAVMAAAIGLSLLSLAILPAVPVDILPDFQRPVVVSYFSYPGLPTLEMEKSVTSRVERALTLAGGIEHQESRTIPGASVIKVYFQPGVDPSSAMNDIVNLEASDMFHLPPGIEYPFTLRSEPANLPVVLAAIGGDGLSESQLYTIGYYAVRNRMGGLQGVQIPHPFGGKFRQLMVYVDPAKLRAVSVSAEDVVEALNRSNLVLAAGTAKLGHFEYQIHPENTLPTTEQIEAVPIAVRDGRPIFIRDVGRAVDDAAIQYNIVRVDGKRSVYCPLLREPGENTIAVVDRIREGLAREIPKMKAQGDIPEATEVMLVNDQSNYIRDAMRNLLTLVGLGAVLVSLVVVVFLGRILPTLAVLLVLVLAMLIGGLGFALSGETINVMTLGGISLAIGTVVDGGIVVLENILRHQRMGKSSAIAAREGAHEVAGPVLAGTVTTLAVFLPVIFLTGMIRDLFEPLAIAASWTITASYIVAMTVVPAFCSRFLGRRLSRERQAEAPDKTVSISESPEPRGPYVGLLRAAIGQRWLVVLAMTGLVAASALLVPRIGTELFPEVDAGTFELRVRTIPGTRLERTEGLVARVEQTIREVIPPVEIASLISNIGLPVGKGAGFSTVLSPNSGPDSAFLVVNLKPGRRARSTRSYIEQLRPRLAEAFPEEKFFFVSGGIIQAALNEGVAAPIDIQVSAGSLEAARRKAEQVARAVAEVPGAVDVQIAQALDFPQLDVQVDRTRAKYLGLDQDEVARTILTALGSSVGYRPTIWIDPASGVDFFMGVQYEDNEIDSLSEIENIPLSLNTADGPMTVPLSNVATVRRVNIPGEIAHYNIGRIYDVYVNVSGRDLGSVAAGVDRVLAALPEEPGITLTVRGPVETMKRGGRMLGVGLAVATLLVYLVMMAQFRSLTDPLIIMLAVPLGLAGVITSLALTNTTLNIQSLMGTLMMIGVVVNNSILLVEFANGLLLRGYDPARAALMAAQTRLRPILMTSLTLVASMLPLCFPLAPGGEAMIPLARALVGGLLASTILTLFLVPCVFAIVKRPVTADGLEVVQGTAS